MKTSTIPELNTSNQDLWTVAKKEKKMIRGGGLCVLMYVLYVCETRGGVHEQTSSPPPLPPRPPGAADIKGSLLCYSLGENKTKRQQDVAKNFRPFQMHFAVKKKKKERGGERKVGDYLTSRGKISPFKTDGFRFAWKFERAQKWKILTKLKEIKHTRKVGAVEKAGETVTNSTGCIYNARGLHSIQLMIFSYVAVA